MTRRRKPKRLSDTPWMTMHQAADYLQIDYRTIYRYKKDYGLPFCRLGGIYRFSRDVIDAWMLAHAESHPITPVKPRQRKARGPRVVKDHQQGIG